MIPEKIAANLPETPPEFDSIVDQVTQKIMSQFVYNKNVNQQNKQIMTFNVPFNKYTQGPVKLIVELLPKSLNALDAEGEVPLGILLLKSVKPIPYANGYEATVQINAEFTAKYVRKKPKNS